MALGDRLKKVASSMSSSSHRRQAEDARAAAGPHGQQPPPPMRSHKSNASILSTSSSGTSGDARGHADEYPNQAMIHGHYHHAMVNLGARPQSTSSGTIPSPSTTHQQSATAATTSACGSSSGSGSGSGAGSTTSGRAPTNPPKVIMKGYLLVKKGMLKGYEKRFYFLHARSADLYSFKDEFSFDEWRAAELPLQKVTDFHGHHSQQHQSQPILEYPAFVCTVLRGDRTIDSSVYGRAIAIIAGDETKNASYKFVTPTPEDCDTWIKALHHVQLSRRHRVGSENNHSNRNGHSHSNNAMATHQPATHRVTDTIGTGPQHHRALGVEDQFEALLHQHAHRATTSTTPSSTTSSHRYQQQHQQHQQRSDNSSLLVANGNPRISDTSDSVSQKSDHSSHHTSTHHLSATKSVTGMATSSSSAPQQPGKMLLFVPAAGSAISISDRKLAQAKKEMEELVARGAKPPTRGGMENARATKWRYGVPEYILNDLEYVKGKTRDHETTPLESYTETCCQTFVMEATHKALYHEWTSVRHDYFYIQVNDGDRIVGNEIKENDLFGLLYLNDIEVDMDLREGEEMKDPRAVLSEAFTQGFPMEILDVYTQPPECHFAWRHWGRFTGRYKGVRGNGQLIELRGFGQTHLDSGKLFNLRLFFKQRDLFDQLNKAVAASVTASASVAQQTQAQAAAPHPRAPPPSQRTAVVATAVAPSTATTATQRAPAPAAPVAAAPPPVSSPPGVQQRPMRSDKLSDESIGDFTNVHITAPARTKFPTPPNSGRDPATNTMPAQQPHATPVNRANIYQRFMPQAPGA